MKLYIKQKVFSFNSKFNVKDEFGYDKYFVEGELFSFGRKLHIYDVQGQEVAFVKQKVMTFLPKYEIYVRGSYVAEIVKEFTFFRQSYCIKGINGITWSISGDCFAHDYYISNGSYTVASVNKAWFTWGDSYEINILNTDDELVAITAVLAIDCAMESN